jgi:hypothetical protein
MKQAAAAFVKAQKNFAPALKQAKNPHFKSQYADLATCVDAVIASLNENNLALIQVSHECADGVLIETKFLHESGEEITGGKLHVPATKQDAQGYGSALTYARRYGLMAACGIAPEDDDGNAATAAQKQKNEGPSEALKAARVAALKGTDALKAHWLTLSEETRAEIGEKALRELQATAKSVMTKVPA